jgi:hypothetical protein
MLSVACHECKVTESGEIAHCKMSSATCTVAAHIPFGSVGIEVEHSEIIPLAILNKHQPVGTDAESSVAQFSDEGTVGVGNHPLTVSDQDEIIAGSLVFVKAYFHSVKLKLIILVWQPQSVKKSKICKTI